jgi:ElaB/YqjD/DUF883 family membrane-anchored ribosome-binding protein
MTQSTHTIENDVKETLESGVDIYQRVRAITLRALTERELDMDNIKAVVEAVFKGIGAGISSQYEPAKSAFTEAVTAIDDALEKTAEASKLAIEEAASRAGEFSDNDLNQAAEELKNLENVFLETLEKVGHSGNEMVVDIARNFVAHARQNGTAVGRHTREAMETLENVMRKGQQAASNTASILAKIGSGILTGIADSLDPGRPSS